MARRASPSRPSSPGVRSDTEPRAEPKARSQGRSSRSKRGVASPPSTPKAPSGRSKRAKSAGPERTGRARPPFSVLVLSGPNLQLLGTREPEIYGKDTLADIHARLGALAEERGATVDCRQSNHEGELLDWLGAAPWEGFAGVLLNGGLHAHFARSTTPSAPSRCRRRSAPQPGGARGLPQGIELAPRAWEVVGSGRTLMHSPSRIARSTARG
jgi:hypothetical protein